MCRFTIHIAIHLLNYVLQPAAQYMTITELIAASYEMFGYISQRSIDKMRSAAQLEVSLVCMIIICIHSVCTTNALLTAGYYNSNYSINSVHFFCAYTYTCDYHIYTALLATAQYST